MLCIIFTTKREIGKSLNNGVASGFSTSAEEDHLKHEAPNHKIECFKSFILYMVMLIIYV